MILILCVFLLIPWAASRTQNYFQSNLETPVAPYESDILSARPVRYLLAVGGGVLAYQHLGSFSPNCDCNFSGEKGTRALFGAEFSVHYPKLGFAVKGLLLYQDFSADFSYNVTRMSVVVGDDPDIPVQYLKSSSVDLQYLSLTTSAVWFFPYTQMYLSGGLEIGYSLTSEFDHIEEIKTPNVYYYDGSTKTTLLPKSEIRGADGLRFGLAVSFGVDITLSSRIFLTPEVGGVIPLTSVTSENNPQTVQQNNWRVVTERAMLFLKVRL